MNTIVTANSLATWSGTWSCQTVKVLSQNGMLKGKTRRKYKRWLLMKIVEKTFSSQPVPFTFYGQSFSFLSAALLIQVFNRIESVEKAHITTECRRKKFSLRV